MSVKMEHNVYEVAETIMSPLTAAVMHTTTTEATDQEMYDVAANLFADDDDDDGDGNTRLEDLEDLPFNTKAFIRAARQSVEIEQHAQAIKIKPWNHFRSAWREISKALLAELTGIPFFADSKAVETIKAQFDACEVPFILLVSTRIQSVIHAFSLTRIAMPQILVILSDYVDMDKLRAITVRTAHDAMVISLY